MKIIKKGDDARSSMLKGLNTAVDLAKVTLGGKGKNVMINTAGSIHTTKDGVTVLKNVAMTDDVEDMGVKLVLEAAENQVSECGDGTTSVSILLQAIINKGMKTIKSGGDPLLIRRGVEKAVNLSVDFLEKLSEKIDRDSDRVFQIAKVSAHGDEDIANIISDAIKRTGEHSHITVEESKGVDTHVEVTDGFKYHSGWLSHLFINNVKKMTCDLDNPFILIYEGKIRELKEIVGLLEFVEKSRRSLVIVSDNMDGDALSSLAVNAKNGALKVVAINPHGHSHEDTQFRLQDLAIATGGKVLSPDHGDRLSDFNPEDLGVAKKVIVGHKETLIVEGEFDKEKLDKRVDVLETQVSSTKNKYEKELLKSRLAALTGGIGVIHVGGTLDTESKERKDRVDDALGAALASVESGVVPGGGVSLLLAKKELEKNIKDSKISDDEMLGVEIIMSALELPFKQIVSNAGMDSENLLNELNTYEDGYGYNVVDEKFINMVEEGLIDPAKVEINVVKNASSMAIQFLNTEGIISPKINQTL